jgi:hypothetical protein
MTDVSSILVGGFIGFISATLSPLISNTIQEKFFGPKLEVIFSEDIEGCVTKTKAKHQIANQGFPGEAVSIKVDACYLRLRVKNKRKKIAKQCRPFLIDVEVWDTTKAKYTKTAFSDSIQAGWACAPSREEAFKPKDIPNGIDQFIDLISTSQANPTSFNIEINPMPYRYEPLFTGKKKFRFTVQVTGDNVPPVASKVVLNWKGNWNDFILK